MPRQQEAMGSDMEREVPRWGVIESWEGSLGQEVVRSGDGGRWKRSRGEGGRGWKDKVKRAGSWDAGQSGK